MNQQKQHIDPPKWAERFFEWYCYPPLFDSIIGDLYERFDENLEKHGRRKANRKFCFDVMRFMNRHTLKRKGQSKYFNNMSILSNYFKVGFRNLTKNRSFTAINVLGLSVSMAVCLVIILMINDQLSYDDWQANANETYRLTHRNNGDINVPMATVPMPLGKTMQEEFAGFEHMVTFRRGFGGDILQNGKAIELQGYFTEPSFFDLFKDQYPMGQTLEVGDKRVFTSQGDL